jgi:hypothetical protein
MRHEHLDIFTNQVLFFVIESIYFNLLASASMMQRVCRLSEKGGVEVCLV